MKIKKKILCITPIKNIPEVFDRLNNFFEIIYLPNANFDDVLKLDQKLKESIDIIFTNPNRTKIYLGGDFLDLFNKITVICTASTGTVHIDENYCKYKNIKVISLKPVIKLMKDITSTAELAFTFMMSGIRNLIPSIEDVKKGSWDCEVFIGRQVSELKIGLIGFGRLGKAFSKYCLAFSGKLAIYDPFVKIFSVNKNLKFEKSLEKLIRESDVISIHASVNSTSINLINASILKFAKSNLLIINTARGEIVNEKDILSFLIENPEAKYFTDVLSFETEKEKSKLLNSFKAKKLKNQLIITPHIGGMSHYSRKRAYNLAVDQLLTFYRYE